MLAAVTPVLIDRPAAVKETLRNASLLILIVMCAFASVPLHLPAAAKDESGLGAELK
jgi:hypothetical protein